jgi:hypothetical protein
MPSDALEAEVRRLGIVLVDLVFPIVRVIAAKFDVR